MKTKKDAEDLSRLSKMFREIDDEKGKPHSFSFLIGKMELGIFSNRILRVFDSKTKKHLMDILDVDTRTADELYRDLIRLRNKLNRKIATLKKISLDKNEIGFLMKNEGEIKTHIFEHDGVCFKCNKRVIKGAKGFRVGKFAFEWFCSLACVEKALENNFCNCRSYLSLEDKGNFLNQIATLKKANPKN